MNVTSQAFLDLLKTANCSISVYPEDNTIQIWDNDFEQGLNFNIYTETHAIEEYVTHKAITKAILKARVLSC